MVHFPALLQLLPINSVLINSPEIIRYFLMHKIASTLSTVTGPTHTFTSNMFVILYIIVEIFLDPRFNLFMVLFTIIIVNIIIDLHDLFLHELVDLRVPIDKLPELLFIIIPSFFLPIPLILLTPFNLLLILQSIQIDNIQLIIFIFIDSTLIKTVG